MTAARRAHRGRLGRRRRLLNVAQRGRRRRRRGQRPLHRAEEHRGRLRGAVAAGAGGGGAWLDCRAVEQISQPLPQHVHRRDAQLEPLLVRCLQELGQRELTSGAEERAALARARADAEDAPYLIGGDRLHCLGEPLVVERLGGALGRAAVDHAVERGREGDLAPAGTLSILDPDAALRRRALERQATHVRLRALGGAVDDDLHRAHERAARVRSSLISPVPRLVCANWLHSSIQREICSRLFESRPDAQPPVRLHANCLHSTLPTRNPCIVGPELAHMRQQEAKRAKTYKEARRRLPSPQRKTNPRYTCSTRSRDASRAKDYVDVIVDIIPHGRRRP